MTAAERNAVPLRTAAAEIVALDVYGRAGGRPITEAMVRTRIDELLGHRPGCGCGKCAAAARARPSQVLWIVLRWQRSIAATRGRAER